jgi:glycosyltransferase involved in cell wall biosynthesis
MGQGAPVISSSSTSLPEIVADAGILLGPDDSDGWVEAIEMLLVQPQRRADFAAAAKERAAAFSWQVSTRQLLDLYEEAAEISAAAASNA